MDTKKVWFITGASKGFGLSLVKQLLAANQYVAATSRNTRSLEEAVGATSTGFLPLQMDLVNEESVGKAIQAAKDKFGRIDVVINNAGYGIAGTLEEVSDKEARENFDVNVFGTLNVIRKAMPVLREQQAGHIINIASIAGLAPGIGFGIYSGAKAAVIGLSEVLAQDVKNLGIKVTVVAPGAFRTEFLADSLAKAADPIAAYEDVRNMHQRFEQMNGRQAGDPEKAVAAIIALGNDPTPPVYLLLGEDAYSRAMQKLETLDNTFRANEALSRSTGFQPSSNA